MDFPSLIIINNEEIIHEKNWVMKKCPTLVLCYILTLRSD